jgi:hypothetical protein
MAIPISRQTLRCGSTDQQMMGSRFTAMHFAAYRGNVRLIEYYNWRWRTSSREITESKFSTFNPSEQISRWGIVTAWMHIVGTPLFIVSSLYLRIRLNIDVVYVQWDGPCLLKNEHGVVYVKLEVHGYLPSMKRILSTCWTCQGRAHLKKLPSNYRQPELAECRSWIACDWSSRTYPYHC